MLHISLVIFFFLSGVGMSLPGVVSLLSETVDCVMQSNETWQHHWHFYSVFLS